MPRGTYRHDSEVEERFTCAPDGGGWRYTARRSDGGTVDLVTDGRWRPARLQITAGERWLKGGAAGPDLLWVTAGRERSARAAGFLGESPGLRVAVARSLDLDEGQRADIRLLVLTEPAFAVRTVPQRWTLAGTTWHEAGDATLPVERYETTDLETGEVTEFHLAGDVVVAAPAVALTDLDGPPNLP
jgi:hypothetical protein